MKRIMILTVFLLLLTDISAQPIGFNPSYEITIHEIIDLDFVALTDGVFIDMGYNEGGVFYYHHTLVGYKHSLSKLMKLLEYNRLDFSDPYIDDSYAAEYIENVFDYSLQKIHSPSEIYKVWIVNDWALVWIIDKTNVVIMTKKI